MESQAVAGQAISGSLSSPRLRSTLHQANATALQGNNALHNGTHGIEVSSGSNSHTFVANIAAGNVVFDLKDDNPNCANNVWQNNFFGTSNQACIN